jgi:hypothetical protein
MTPCALPCLRAALYDAHAKREFYGGRGAATFPHAGYVYYNDQVHYPTDDWAIQRNVVRGCEEVRHESGRVCGRQYFEAMLLVDPITLE